MRSRNQAVLILVLLAAGAGCDSGTNGLSPNFEKSGRVAYQAIDRLEPYVSDATDSYEPRLLDAQKAVAEADNNRETSEDRKAAMVLETYLSRVQQAKLTAEGLGYTRDTAEVLGKGNKKAIADLKNAEAENERTLRGIQICKDEARLYFDPDFVLPAAGGPTKGQCVADNIREAQELMEKAK